MSKKSKQFMEDVWKDALEKYNAVDFSLPASDSKGQSVMVTYRCPAETVKLESTVLLSRKFPFRDITEIRRWCQHWGLKALMEMETEQFKDLVRLKELDVTTSRIKDEQKEDVQRINDLVEIVNQAIVMGQRAKARKMVQERKKTWTESYKRDPERRDWLLKQLEEKFNDLSKPARIIPLREMLEAQDREAEG